MSSSTASTTPTVGLIRAITRSAGASIAQPRMHLPAARGDRAQRERGVVAARQRRGGRSGGASASAARSSPGGTSPTRPARGSRATRYQRRCQLSRRYGSTRRGSAAVVEPQPLDVADRLRDGARAPRGSTSGSGASVPMFSGPRSTAVRERVDGRAQPRRQHLQQLRERAGADSSIPAIPVASAQSDRDGDRLVVVEHAAAAACRRRPVGTSRRARASRRRGSRARAGARCRCGWCASTRRAARRARGRSNPGGTAAARAAPAAAPRCRP